MGEVGEDSEDRYKDGYNWDKREWYTKNPKKKEKETNFDDSQKKSNGEKLSSKKYGCMTPLKYESEAHISEKKYEYISKNLCKDKHIRVFEKI
jgi:hypothetical protein